jgi:hypothetical protein
VAVNTVSAAFSAPTAAVPGGASVTVLQSPAGATGDSTFIIDCRALKNALNPSMRDRTIHLLNNGTQFTTIASVTTSLDGTIYESSKVWFSAVTTPFQEGTQAAITITTGTITTWVAGHDFNYIKIVTTVGDATSGFTLVIGG